MQQCLSAIASSITCQNHPHQQCQCHTLLALRTRSLELGFLNLTNPAGKEVRFTYKWFIPRLSNLFLPGSLNTQWLVSVDAHQISTGHQITAASHQGTRLCKRPRCPLSIPNLQLYWFAREMFVSACSIFLEFQQWLKKCSICQGFWRNQSRQCRKCNSS